MGPNRGRTACANLRVRETTFCTVHDPFVTWAQGCRSCLFKQSLVSVLKGHTSVLTTVRYTTLFLRHHATTFLFSPIWERKRRTCHHTGVLGCSTAPSRHGSVNAVACERVPDEKNTVNIPFCVMTPESSRRRSVNKSDFERCPIRLKVQQQRGQTNPFNLNS